MDRKVLFVLDSGNRGKVDSFPKFNSPLPISGQNFHRGSVKGNRWKEGYMQRQYSQLCHLEIDPQWSEQWASSCFKQLIFSSRIGLFPFLWGQFLWWWLFISCLQSGHHTILPLGGSFSIYKTTHRTWLGILSVALGRGTNGFWLCLMTKLLLFGFVLLLSFASAVSLFFD